MSFSLQVCINDELVIKGFATYFSETVQTSSISPSKAAKLQAINEKFQRQSSEVTKSLKEYISKGTFTSSEQSNSTDDELMDHTRYNHRSLCSGESPLNVLRRQVSGSCGMENGIYSEPSARIPRSTSQMASSKSPADNAYLNAFGNESMYRRTDTLSSDENSGRVRFLSSRLPSTGSGNVGGYSSIPSKSPDSSNLKPILKKRSSHSTAFQSGGSSSEPEDMFHRKQKQLDKEDSGYSRSGNSDNSVIEEMKIEPSASSSVISIDMLFGSRKETSRSVSDNADFAQRAEHLMHNGTEPPKKERSPLRVSSVIESLRNANEQMYMYAQMPDSCPEGTTRTCEPLVNSSNTVVQPLASKTLPAGYEPSQTQSSVNKDPQALNRTPHLSPSSTSSSVKSPLPSEMLLPKSASSPLHPTSGTKMAFTDGVLIQTNGAPAPRPIFSLEHSQFAQYLRKLNLSSPSLIQAHAWSALARGRDVVGVCSANDEGSVLAYLVPIIHQLVEERQIYAGLPLASGVSDSASFMVLFFCQNWLGSLIH